MSYCYACGAYATLDAAAMCPDCRASWKPSGSQPTDLGIRGPRHPGAP